MLLGLHSSESPRLVGSLFEHLLHHPAVAVGLVAAVAVGLVAAAAAVGLAAAAAAVGLAAGAVAL